MPIAQSQSPVILTFNSDTRPLPRDWSTHFDSGRGVWFYQRNSCSPPQVSYSHPLGPMPQTTTHVYAPQPQAPIRTHTLVQGRAHARAHAHVRNINAHSNRMAAHQMTNQIAPKPSLGQALYAKAVESMQPKAVSPPLESSSSVSEYTDSARSPSVGSPTAPSRSSAYYEGEDDDEIVANMNRVTLGRVPSYATSHNHVPGRLPRAELAGAAHGGRLQTVDELEQYDLGTTTHTTRHLPTHRHTTPLTLTPSTTSPDRLSTTARLPAPSMYPSSYTLPEDEPVEPAALYPSPFTQSTRLLNSQTGTGGRMEDGIRRNASVGGGGLGRAVSMNASIPATNGGAAAHTHSRMRDQTQSQAHIPISTSGPSYGYAQINPRRHSTSTNTSTSTFTSLSPTSPSFLPSSTSSTPSSIGKQKTTVVHTLAALNPNPQPSKHPSVPPVQHIKMSAASAHVPRAVDRVTQPQLQPQVVVGSQQQQQQQSFVGGQTVPLSQSSLPNQVQQVPLQQQEAALQSQQQIILRSQQQAIPQQQQPVQYQLQYQRNPSQVQIPPPPPLPPAPVLAPAPSNNTSQSALLGAAGAMAGLLGAAAVNTLVNGDPTESVISLSGLGLGGDSQVDGGEYAPIPTTYAVDPVAGQQPLQQPQEYANVGAVVPTTTAADPNSAVQLQMLQMQQQQQIQQNYHEMQTQMQLAQMQMAIQQQQQQAQQVQTPITTQRPPVAGQTYTYAYAQPTQPQMQVQQQQVPLTQAHMNANATTTYTQQQLQQQQMIAQQQQIIAQQQAQIQAQAQQQQQQQQAPTSAAGSSQSTTNTIINSLSSPVGQAALGVALKVGGTLLGQMLSSDDE